MEPAPHGPRRSVSLSTPVRVAREASLPGILVRRYKRFLADVELADGRVVTVHCPNPGSMSGTDRPGSQVRCSHGANPKRKLAHTLEMIRVGRVWVGLHAAFANRLVREGLVAGALPALRGYEEIRGEVALEGGSRLDFLLTGHPADPRPAYVEVKSATCMARRSEGGAGGALAASPTASPTWPRARFPDAVTLRGRRHLDQLVRLRESGARAALVFVVQRADCRALEPADDIDPEYGAALRAAVRAGVEVHALGARVLAKEIRLEALLPVLL